MRRVGTLLALSLILPASAAAAPSAKLSERLRDVAAPGGVAATPAAQNREAGLPASGAGSFSRLGDAYVTEIRTPDTGAGTVDRLKAAGADVLHVSARYDTVTAAVDRRDLDAVARVPGVGAVDEVLLPEVGAVGERASTCPTGTAVSEGNAQLKAALARTTYGVDGSGVEVGVLSDSFNKLATAPTAADDVASGDLPGTTNTCGFTTPVQVLQDAPSAQADEGRAMLQLVHDVAPGAQLAFATAYISESSFADNIIALKNAGAKVIVDDVIYLQEPFYQDGPVANAVSTVTDAGVSYFSMAFNNELRVAGQDVGSWETPAFRPTACPAVVTADDNFTTGDSCMDFAPGSGTDATFGIGNLANRGVKVVLQWNEPRGGVTGDFDLYLLRNGAVTTAESHNVSSTLQQPFEYASLGTTVAENANDVVIVRKAGTASTPRMKFVISNNGSPIKSFEYPNPGGGDVVGPTIFGHNGTAKAQTVGAIAYDDTVAPETYSGRGPVTHYFAPVPSTAPLGSPEVLSKPDITATDGGITTFFGDVSHRFYGTSAAAPHAAAVAALQLQATPGLGQADVKADQRGSGTPIGAFGPLAIGSGLLDAVAAIEFERTALTVTTAGPPALGTDRAPATTFSANRAATFTCALDAAPAADCVSPYTPPALGDGPHLVSVQATDRAGKRAVSQVAFTVDTTGPLAAIGSGPAGLTNVRQPAFAFSAGEAGATTQCSFDGGAFAACASPATAPAPLGDGPHAFAVRGTDGLGNAGAPATRAFAVDGTAPTVAFKKKPKKTVKSRKKKVRVAFAFKTEAGATLRCKLDKGAFKACKTTRKVTVKRGKHALSVRATDAAGNVSQTVTSKWTVKKKRKH